jgi:hypothetical protein
VGREQHYGLFGHLVDLANFADKSARRYAAN